jgi:hypothetical protein
MAEVQRYDSNLRAFLMPPTLDGRTLFSKRYMETGSTIIHELGGRKAVSRTQLLLVRRLIILSLMLDDIENDGELSTKDPRFPDYLRLTREQFRLIGALGLGQPAEKSGERVTDLHQYLAATQGDDDDE